MFESELHAERQVRQIIRDRITARNPHIYALENKKAVDIVICRDGHSPALFFVEVKFHKAKHGRLGFGSSSGGGFQPEILQRSVRYFERNLRWVLASEEHDGYVFVDSTTIRNYIAGGNIGEKFNNIQSRIFKQEALLSQEDFTNALTRWLGATPHS